MHYALSQGNFDVVSILLDSKVCNINRPNAAGYTAVMLVSLAQVRSQTHRRVLQRFLADADVNIRAKQVSRVRAQHLKKTLCKPRNVISITC